MIPVKHIAITRVEGPTHLCDKPRVFNSWEAAKGWLYMWSSGFPKDGTYDKHDFTVEFVDGETYSGRLDCKHHTRPDNDLDVFKHILEFCQWMAGEAKNPYCGREKYLEYHKRQDPKEVEAYRDFLRKYLEP